MDRGFEIVGVSPGGADRKALAAFLAKHEFPSPQVGDAKGGPAPLARGHDITVILFDAL